ncbi:tyrosine-type recombinase/integrase [Oceanimonas sp. AH20CE76]|uniref:tyrosine-type recombinase/integrase n=1 Tax=Oceanimonas sp. AH20CE76 TaxID=2977120 RepID=UPI0031FED634
MDNPLILPPSQPALMTMLGREHRQAKRQQRDAQILRAAMAIFRQHLPSMMQIPPIDTDFDKAWPQIDTLLQQELKSEGAYRYAYSFICKQLEIGNRQGIWSVQVPDPYITLRRRRPSRTLRWQHSSHLIAEAEHHWLERLQEDTNDPDVLFARLLLSMVLYGGLGRPALWPALAQALHQPRPLRGNNEACWLVLEPAPGRGQPSNLYIDDPDTNERLPHCEVLYAPDPISLGLLRQFLKHKSRDWQPPTTPEQCLFLLKQELGIHCSLTQLATGGITVAEHLGGVSLPQVLVEYATGRQPSASLPYDYWQRLLRPALLTCNEQDFHRFTRFPKLTPRPVGKPVGRRSQPYLLTRLREVFQQDRARPKSKRAVIEELEVISNERLLLPEATLVNWLINHLAERDNAVSSAKRYFDAIAADWLMVTNEEDLLSYSGEEFHDLYLSLLNRPRKQQAREYQAGRLEDLHVFGVQQLGFPPLPEPLILGTDSVVHVSAAVVDEPLFGGLLKQFQCFGNLDPHLQRTYICFLIMAYRTGLRPGELAKLRLSDIEPSPTGWLFIRNNRYGNNKTEAGLRKVPLFPLLTAEEADVVRHYLSEQRIKSKSDNELLFHQTAENQFEQLDITPLSLAVSTLLKDLSGGLYFRLYHLRHSALSRLQLLLHTDQLRLPTYVDALLPYDDAKRQEIRTLITGHGRLRDRYHALAAFAGHSSPDISLSTYLHFTDLLLGLYLQQHRRELTSHQAQVLLGLRPHRIRLRHRGKQVITPANTAGFLRKRLNRYIRPATSPRASRPASIDASLQPVKQRQYEPMLAVLSKIQAGYDHREIAWFYQLSTEQIMKWHQSALALRALTTEKQLPRLFPRSRRHQLLPPEPVGVAEKRDVAKALAACRELYRSSQQRDELKWLAQYTLTHCNSSRSGIRFDDAETFRRYMAVVTQLFDWPRWQLQLRHTDKSIIKRWHCGPLSVQLYPMKQKARFEQGSGWLTLRHQEEADRKEPDKSGYASHSLRIVLHRLAIILFRADDIAAWQAGSIKPAKEG